MADGTKLKQGSIIYNHRGQELRIIEVIEHPSGKYYVCEVLYEFAGEDLEARGSDWVEGVVLIDPGNDTFVSKTKESEAVFAAYRRALETVAGLERHITDLWLKEEK